jgi:DNA-binding NarL/FixJ family response regulator
MNSLRDGVAVVNGSGEVMWANAAWLAHGAQPTADAFLGTPVGTNLLEGWSASSRPGGRAIALSVRAVVEREIAYFELEYLAPADKRRYVVSALPLAAAEPGAVITIHEATARAEEVTQRWTAPAARVAPARAPESLTPREAEILSLLSRGMDNRSIAEELKISYATVRGHVRSLIDKLGARSRLEAVALAYRGGLVPR